MKRGGIRLAGVAVGLCAAFLFSGCSAPEAPNAQSGEPQRIAGSLVEYFEMALAILGGQDADSPSHLSDVQRAMLERAIVAGEISVADYEAAHAELDTCYRERGLEVAWLKGSSGLYRMPAVDFWAQGLTNEMFTGITDVCAHLGAIPSLYEVQVSNPELYADQWLVAANCLRAAGIVDAGYTTEDLHRDIDNEFSGLATTFDLYEPVANECLWNSGFAFYKT